MSEINGLSLAQISALAKKVKNSREYLGMSVSDLSKMLGLPEGQIEYLEEFAVIEQEEKDDRPC